MHRCLRRKQASVYTPATTHKLPNQSKLMTQSAYANEPASSARSLGAKSLDSKVSDTQAAKPQISQAFNQVAQGTLTQDKKFELLSAYIDNECSDQERQLVEHWLACDLQLQQQYQAQLKLQLAIKALL